MLAGLYRIDAWSQARVLARERLRPLNESGALGRCDPASAIKLVDRIYHHVLRNTTWNHIRLDCEEQLIVSDLRI